MSRAVLSAVLLLAVSAPAALAVDFLVPTGEGASVQETKVSLPPGLRDQQWEEPRAPSSDRWELGAGGGWPGNHAPIKAESSPMGGAFSVSLSPLPIP
ncbi:serine protease inhibitor Kazal-type 8 isoform X1 [Myotis myotis]|uniref:serine protease inhibitor Kazal-type 8 isoform X1 n=1 Tax=Myotis myotis TaxID=51298 RepID=UPI00174CA4A6|nr:serine protease inhibitor Kazal-type 8 isoform X1 [Myotis myotis]